jgi:predicted nucleic-acid-binding Zn-ribbon protein
MSKGTKGIKNKDHHKKSTKERKRIVSSKISKFANGFKIPDNVKNNKLNKCPKCSSDMIQHPSLVSMPLSSASHQTGSMRKINIEDQDANFVFKFKSCKKCGYSEFYLHDGTSSNRV